MLPLALSAFEKAAKIPSSFWLKLFLAIVFLFVAIFVLRKLLHVNKFIFGIVGVVFLFVVAFQWVYERNEPAFLTPLVDHIAPFFPSKGAYEIRQASDPTPGSTNAHPTPRH